MDLKLRGKRAIVTGATRGIGRAIAETLADEGCDVAICARTAEQVEEAVIALKAKGVKALGGVVDVGDGQALRDWVKAMGEQLGGIDILVSNPSARGDRSEEGWVATFNVDVLGAVRATEAAMPFLEESAEKNGDAAIVITSSAAAIISTGVGSYGPMRAALINLAKGLAKEGAPKHVRANTISPGTVYFEGGGWHRAKQNNPEVFEHWLGLNPMGRMATPQEIANAAVFLASPVSSFTSGINLIVDGVATDRVNY
jgi:3-oxoacyl-[acyl-carrier protein] reductase